MAQLSVVNPIGWAVERTKLVLFRPFDISLWFTMGFCCFLANISQYLGNACNGGSNWNPGGMPSQGQISQAMPIIITVAALIVIIAIGFTVLLTWLESRGQFMFLDNVVNRRGAVVEPWKAYKAHANSLFKVSLVIKLLYFFLLIVIILAALAVAWPDIKAQEFGSAALTAVLGGAGLLFVISIVFIIVTSVLVDFVVPVMYARNEYCMPAWQIFRTELLEGHVGSFILFYLMKFVLSLAIGTIALVATCATCCIAGLPYVQNVVLLPIFVFGRLYPLSFLEQFGPEWAIISRFGGHLCRWCNHDLRYSDRSGLCPQCGRTQDDAAGTDAAAPPLQADDAPMDESSFGEDLPE